MKDFTRLSTRLLLTLLSTTLHACVVVPKTVASYDEQCKVATQKMELTLEQAETFNDIDCIHNDCGEEFAGAIFNSALIMTTSAIVSGSIALAGNTLYWLESQGECPNMNQMNEQPPKVQQEKKDDEYLITEESIAAKS